jgi:hypothetical protein
MVDEYGEDDELGGTPSQDPGPLIGEADVAGDESEGVGIEIEEVVIGPITIEEEEPEKEAGPKPRRRRRKILARALLVVGLAAGAVGIAIFAHSVIARVR